MLKINIITVLLALTTTLAGQSETQSIPISVSYFSHLLFQPGVKVGTQISIKDWTKEKENRLARNKQLAISPQLAYFANVGNNQNVLLNIDLDYRTQKAGRKFFSTWSVGLGYLAQFQVTALRLNLGDGSKEKVRERWDHILPSVSYAFGKVINTKMSWYSKYTLGSKINFDGASTMMLFMEAGITYQISKNK